MPDPRRMDHPDFQAIMAQIDPKECATVVREAYELFVDAKTVGDPLIMFETRRFGLILGMAAIFLNQR